jgi:hypothetical protein
MSHKAIPTCVAMTHTEFLDKHSHPLHTKAKYACTYDDTLVAHGLPFI